MELGRLEYVVETDQSKLQKEIDKSQKAILELNDQLKRLDAAFASGAMSAADFDKASDSIIKHMEGLGHNIAMANAGMVRFQDETKKVNQEASKAAQKFLQFGRTLDDLQYVPQQGLRPIVNNIMEIAPAVGIAMIAINTLGKAGMAIYNAWKDAQPAAALDPVGKSLDEINKKIRELEAKPVKLSADTKQLGELKKFVEEMEERVSAARSLGSQKSEQERRIGPALERQFGEAPGGAKQVEAALRKQFVEELLATDTELADIQTKLFAKRQRTHELKGQKILSEQEKSEMLRLKMQIDDLSLAYDNLSQSKRVALEASGSAADAKVGALRQRLEQEKGVLNPQGALTFPATEELINRIRKVDPELAEKADRDIANARAGMPSQEELEAQGRENSIKFRKQQREDATLLPGRKGGIAAATKMAERFAASPNPDFKAFGEELKEDIKQLNASKKRQAVIESEGDKLVDRAEKFEKRFNDRIAETAKGEHQSGVDEMASRYKTKFKDKIKDKVAEGLAAGIDRQAIEKELDAFLKTEMEALEENAEFVGEAATKAALEGLQAARTALAADAPEGTQGLKAAAQHHLDTEKAKEDKKKAAADRKEHAPEQKQIAHDARVYGRSVSQTIGQMMLRGLSDGDITEQVEKYLTRKGILNPDDVAEAIVKNVREQFNSGNLKAQKTVGRAMGRRGSKGGRAGAGAGAGSGLMPEAGGLGAFGFGFGPEGMMPFGFFGMGEMPAGEPHAPQHTPGRRGPLTRRTRRGRMLDAQARKRMAAEMPAGSPAMANPPALKAPLPGVTGETPALNFGSGTGPMSRDDAIAAAERRLKEAKKRHKDATDAMGGFVFGAAGNRPNRAALNELDRAESELFDSKQELQRLKQANPGEMVKPNFGPEPGRPPVAAPWENLPGGPNGGHQASTGKDLEKKIGEGNQIAQRQLEVLQSIKGGVPAVAV